MHHLAFNNAGIKREIVASGGITALVKLLSIKHIFGKESNRLEAAELLMSLAADDTKNQDKLIAAGALPLLVPLIQGSAGDGVGFSKLTTMFDAASFKSLQHVSSQLQQLLLARTAASSKEHVLLEIRLKIRGDWGFVLAAHLYPEPQARAPSRKSRKRGIEHKENMH
eukprot:gene25387-11049_t